MLVWSLLTTLSALVPLAASQLQDSSATPEQAVGWSEWGSWSGCSRTCGGGVTHRIRKCVHDQCSPGQSSHYKICNMQVCPETTPDFRATQCAAYNAVAYRGRFYEWLPYQDPEAPCALTCHARSASFVAKLAPEVKDGTRCREGSLDMCVKGKCLAVGCDLTLGSGAQVDACGVCNGDGSSCDGSNGPLHVWKKTPFSPCSVTCGGGYQMSTPRCLVGETGNEVDERLCNKTARPTPQIKECNKHPCPPTWVSDSWSPCSSSCGVGGRQSRQVHCALEGTGGRTPVSPHMCLKQRPPSERLCNQKPCPRWTHGPWSGCSVTCGLGQKVRSVKCADASGEHSEACDLEKMPATRIDCDSRLTCSLPQDNQGTYLFSDILKGSQEDAPPRQSAFRPPWSKKSNDISTEPSYVVGEWGECSTTCGQGFRIRSVDCKIFLEFSRTVAKLQDYECPGTKPVNLTTCYPRPCSVDLNKPEDRKMTGVDVTYSWRSNGFTPCSASCLGGTRESVIQCVRDHDQAVVRATQCDIELKPDAVTHTCNDHPCPPRWNVSEFGGCSKSCGGGEMVRRVACVHEVVRGASAALRVDESHCPPPRPPDRRLCNLVECPARWSAQPWGKCSVSCGGGEKVRKLRCLKEKAFGQVVELAPSQCPHHRPRIRKLCNPKPCPPQPTSGGTVFVQQKPQQRIFLRAGGSASIFQGTHLKIRCPVAHFSNDTAPTWYKDDKKLIEGRRVKVSQKGALRIRKLSSKDAGKYSCEWDSQRADIYLTVRPQNEDRTVESLTPARTTGSPDRTSEEHVSHEMKNSIENNIKYPPQNVLPPAAIGSSTEGRIPLYMQVSSSTAPPKTIDSEELVPHKEKSNHVPQWGDTSRQLYDGALVAKQKERQRHFDRNDLVSDQEELNRGTPHLDLPGSMESGAASVHGSSLWRHLPGVESSILGHGQEQKNNLQFEWLISDWSQCTQSCGDGGYQVRSSQCLVRLGNVSKPVDSGLCEDAGQPSPSTVRSCGREACPHWETAPWSQCLESGCFAWHKSVERRAVYCRAANGTDLSPGLCETRTRPRRKRECLNARCTAAWKVGEWSECVGGCRSRGLQSRILQCMWQGSSRPAGNACRDQQRPLVLRPCDTGPCPSELPLH